MNDFNVKNIIFNRLNGLLDTENLIDWSSSLNEFFTVYKSHYLLQGAFENIHRKKVEEYEPFFCAYKIFVNELSNLFEQLQKELHEAISPLVFPREIVNKEFTAEALKLPYYRPESEFFKACQQLRSFFEELMIKLFLTSKPISSKCVSLLTGYLNIFTRIIYRHSVDETEENKVELSAKIGFFCRKSQTFQYTVRYHVYEQVPDLEFKSFAFLKMADEFKTLAYAKEGAIWKKLNILDQWVVRTKNGISPEILKNQYHVFCYLEVEKAIKDLSTYLIDYLAQSEQVAHQSSNVTFLNISSSITLNSSIESEKKDLSEPIANFSKEDKETPNSFQKQEKPSVHVPIQALTLFPYQTSHLDNYAFWIVSSFSDGTYKSYFVKEVIPGSGAYKFIETLLSCEWGKDLNLEDSSSARSELSLTKQLAKIFFAKKGGKRDLFRGFHIFLNDLRENVELVELEEQLSKLNKQKNLPQFPASEYCQFVESHYPKNKILTHSDVGN